MAKNTPKRFVVHSIPENYTRTVRNPHWVVDTTTNLPVDEYSSKRAAQQDAKFRNEQEAGR